MSFTHQYFTIDTSSRKVFDVNYKELYLTGNAYRVLVFLCSKKHATLTEIGKQLDWAKDYDENHIRQYRYKINTIIGYPVVEYKNGIYSLIGETTEQEKVPEVHRNTVLLQPSAIHWEGMKNKLQFSKWPAAIAVVVLVLSFLRMPYGFFTFLRFVVTVVAVYYAYYLYDVIKKQDWQFWLLVIMAVLFNPFFPVYLKTKAAWTGIDVVAGIFFVFLDFTLSKTSKLNQSL